MTEFQNNLLREQLREGWVSRINRQGESINALLLGRNSGIAPMSVKKVPGRRLARYKDYFNEQKKEERGQRMKEIVGSYFGTDVIYFPTMQWIYELSNSVKLNRPLEYLLTLRWQHWEVWKGQELEMSHMVNGRKLKLNIQIYPEIPSEIANDPQRLFFVLASRTARGGKFIVTNEAPAIEEAIKKAIELNRKILTKSI